MSSSGTVLRNKARAHKLCEGWLEYKCHKPSGFRWEEIWVVLKGNVFYIFKNTDTREQNQMGNLTIDGETQFTKKKDDPNKGFKFELSTGKRINTFKSKKFSERELWRAYVTGVAKGKLPSDIDLLNVEEIQHNLDLFLHGPLPQPPDHLRESTVSAESGVGSIDGISGFSVPYPSNPSLGSRGTSGSRGSDGSQGSVSRGTNQTLDNGGPTMVHKFYDDRSRNQQTPSWFFHHCSRQLAESVLKVATHHGNTLMRESTSHKDNGSYVISKLIWNERRRTEPVFEHYEVMRTAHGYKVNVENQHDPMKCLAHVMEYFMQTSGGNTRPMETNDMKTLGLETPNYETTIYRRTEPQPEAWVWPPPDYEEQNLPRSNQSNRHSQGPSHTVSPGILKKQGNALPKTVGFSRQSKTNSSIHHTHVGSGRSRYPAQPSMHEMAQRSNAAEQLRNLDDVIASHDVSGFEHSQVYVNEQSQEQNHEEDAASRQRTKSYSPPPPPPVPSLPTPHRPLPQHSYVNDNDTEMSATLDALPVAPPAPRVPIVNRSPSTASSESHRRLSNNSPASITKSPSRSVSTPAFAASSAQPITAQQKPTPTLQPVKKSYSVGQFTGVNSPSSFPTWSETNKTPNVDLRKNASKINDAAKSIAKPERVVSEPILPGVDDTNPGGVSDLRSRFEVKTPVVNTRLSANMTPLRKTMQVHSEAPLEKDPTKQRDGLSSRHSTPVLFTLTSASDVDTNTSSRTGSFSQYYINPTNKSVTNTTMTTLSEHTVVASVTSAGSGACSSRNVSVGASTYKGTNKRVDDVDDANDYDDTANPVDRNSMSVKDIVGKVHFEEENREPTPPSSELLQKRRQTEPALPSFSPCHIEGLDINFKHKLEGLFSGVSNTGPIKSPTEVPKKLFTQQSFEDHEYAELPDGAIQPDDVTYVNDEFNHLR